MSRLFDLASNSLARAAWFAAAGEEGFSRLFLESARELLEARERERIARDGATALAVLVVDDDAAIRTAFESVLEGEGYLVSAVANGREALAWLRAATPLPAVILLDLMMPVMSGHELSEELARDPRLAAIPIVAITAMDVAVGAHVRTVLRKPILAADLLAAVCPRPPAVKAR